MAGACDFSLYELSYNIPAGGGVVDLSNKYLVLATKVAAPPTMETCAEDKVIAEAATRLAADNALADALSDEVATRTLLSTKVNDPVTGLDTKASTAELISGLATKASMAAISDEVTARTNADSNLQSQVTALSASISAPTFYTGRHLWWRSDGTNKYYIPWTATIDPLSKLTTFRIQPTIVKWGSSGSGWQTDLNVDTTDMPDIGWPSTIPIAYNYDPPLPSPIVSTASFIVSIGTSTISPNQSAVSSTPFTLTVSNNGMIKIYRYVSPSSYVNTFYYFPSTTLVWVNQC